MPLYGLIDDHTQPYGYLAPSNENGGAGELVQSIRQRGRFGFHGGRGLRPLSPHAGIRKL